MAEYISREEAVDDGYLSDWYIASVGNEPPVWTDAHIDELLNDFIVIPKDTPAADVQPINRWIKADESLPVYGGMVLICDKSKNIRLGIYTDMGWCSQFGNPMMCKITHWQPLPELPKDGDTNG